MADNINDKHLDNLTKTQLENSSDEIIPTGDLETITPKQGTEIMEVHHHPQVGKKNFKEYLLEGLMIFVAVTMGFFAEGIRESINDHAKEKEYISSMMQDLRADTTSISETINSLTNRLKYIDTILFELKNNNPDVTVINNITSSHFWMYSGFSYNNRTIQQLKNAGNFRLLRNEAVADSIVRYDNRMNTYIMTQLNDLKNTMFAYKDVEAKIISYQQLSKMKSGFYAFDDSVFVNKDRAFLITNDRQMLALYYNKLFLHATLMRLFIHNLVDSKNIAVRLMTFIAKQYDLEND